MALNGEDTHIVSQVLVSFLRVSFAVGSLLSIYLDPETAQSTEKCWKRRARQSTFARSCLHDWYTYHPRLLISTRPKRVASKPKRRFTLQRFWLDSIEGNRGVHLHLCSQIINQVATLKKLPKDMKRQHRIRVAPLRVIMSMTVLLFVLSITTKSSAEDRIVCPRIQSTDASMFLESSDEKKDFWELSGLGFSPTLTGPSGQPLVYAINDGGGGRRFGIFDSGTGVRLLSLRMPRNAPLNLDYEGLTVGSCGIDEGTCIYIADVGDNTARSSNGTRSGRDDQPGYPIYKIKEPDRNDFQDNDVLPDSSVSTLWFNYFHPTSPTRYADCETVFLDNVGWGEGGEVGDFYIVTKWEDYVSLNRLFKIPAQAWAQVTEDTNYTYSPEAVGFYGNAQDSNGLMGYMWTRGEMTFDGTLIALGDYYDQYLFLRCPGMSVAEALAVEGTQYCHTWPIKYWDSQFETIAWAPDKSKTLEISECYSTSCTPDPPMVWSTMDYTYDPGISVACPLTESGASPTAQSPTHPAEMLPSPSPSLEPPSQTSQLQPTPTDGDSPKPTEPVSDTSVAVMSFPIRLVAMFVCIVVTCLVA